MLVESFAVMKKFLPAVVLKGENMYFDDMLQISESELVESVLGEELHIQLEKKLAEDQNLLTMCQRIVSLGAFSKAIPEMDLVLTESGFAVHNSEKMAPASKSRVEALAKSVAERLDKATDALITFLLSSTAYVDWRNTLQFENISSGFICTYSEFKRYAQHTPGYAERYPKSYKDFAKLYPNLATALMVQIAPYLSAEYCSELVEKFKDKETLSLQEKQVLNMVKSSLVAFVMEDNKTGSNYLFNCLRYMRENISQFPTFAASPEAQALDISHSDTPIFSML